MSELVRVVRRAARADDEADAPAVPAPSVLGQALHDANELLPSRDPEKNTGFKLGIYLGVGVPLWYGLASIALLALPVHSASLALMAVFFTASLVGPIAFSWLAALPFTLGFYALQGKDAQGRLRQALVCPYCRDEVGRDGTVICARKGCGALYHRECWGECAERYGGCAIYGCSSRKCREGSAAGYLLRLARLAVAAALFPPRVARAFTSSERESFRAVYRRAVRFSNLFAASNDPAENPPRKMALYVLVSFPLALTLTLTFIRLVVVPRPRHFVDAIGAFLAHDWAVVKFYFLVAGLTFVLPRIFALPPAVLYYTYRSIAEVLRGELAALARADAGGGTVLGRLMAGFGKKECC